MFDLFFNKYLPNKDISLAFLETSWRKSVKRWERKEINFTKPEILMFFKFSNYYFIISCLCVFLETHT